MGVLSFLVNVNIHKLTIRGAKVLKLGIFSLYLPLMAITFQQVTYENILYQSQGIYTFYRWRIAVCYC